VRGEVERRARWGGGAARGKGRAAPGCGGGRRPARGGWGRGQGKKKPLTGRAHLSVAERERRGREALVGRLGPEV
jgi:hypothetical protein